MVEEVVLVLVGEFKFLNLERKPAPKSSLLFDISFFFFCNNIELSFSIMKIDFIIIIIIFIILFYFILNSKK